MKKIILSAFAALFLVGSAFAETVRMGTEGAYPPYNFINDNGEVDGFEKDVGDMLCIRANPVSYTHLTLPTILPV